MKTAICILTSDGWTPIIILGNADVIDTAGISANEGFVREYLINSEAVEGPIEAIEVPIEDPVEVEDIGFNLGETVHINGRLYQGKAVIEKFDGNDIIARAGNGKLYRYNTEDLETGVVSKVTKTTPTEISSDDFEVGQEVEINGNLYQGYGTVERIDGEDVLVRADNDKLYRYHPDDLLAGILK